MTREEFNKRIDELDPNDFVNNLKSMGWEEIVIMEEYSIMKDPKTIFEISIAYDKRVGDFYRVWYCSLKDLSVYLKLPIPIDIPEEIFKLLSKETQ